MEIRWEVEDGYVGPSRPHTVEIPDEEILECESDAEVEDIVLEWVSEAFRDEISYDVLNLDEALELRKKQCQS